ncbi:MAG: RES family NAD+ phosphorylase [Akkermansiaceae bacterium]
MIRAFRLCKTKHLSTAFTGEGARLNGGRWNSPGNSVIYTSSSLSLATLEVLVHLEDPEVFARVFSWVSLEIPDEAVETLDLGTLASGWDADEVRPASQTVGDRWLRSMRSAALAVPSVVTPGEWNYLLNPFHSHFSSVLIGPSQRFRPDPRLFR